MDVFYGLLVRVALSVLPIVYGILIAGGVAALFCRVVERRLRARHRPDFHGTRRDVRYKIK